MEVLGPKCNERSSTLTPNPPRLFDYHLRAAAARYEVDRSRFLSTQLLYGESVGSHPPYAASAADSTWGADQLL